RWYLNIVDTAHICGGGKTGDITGHTSAKRDYRRITVETLICQLPVYILDRIEILAFFSGFYHMAACLYACRSDLFHACFEIQVADIAVGNDHYFSSESCFAERTSQAGKISHYIYGVASFTQLHINS